jgi:hypothetical protein
MVLTVALVNKVFVGPLRVTLTTLADDVDESKIDPLLSTTLVNKSKEKDSAQQKNQQHEDNKNTKEEKSNEKTSNKSVLIMPLYSWYHSSFDSEPDVTHPLFVEFENMTTIEERSC